MKSFKKGFVEVCLEANSIKVILEIHKLYDDDIIFRFTPNSINIVTVEPDKGRQMNVDICGYRTILYEYKLFHADNRIVDEIYVSTNVKQLLEVPHLSGAGKKKTFPFYFKITEQGKLDGGKIYIPFEASTGRKGVKAAVIKPKNNIRHYFNDMYSECAPNSRSKSELFCAVISSGAGRTKTVKGSEFILCSNGRIRYISKESTESILEQRKGKKKIDFTDAVYLDQDLKCDIAEDDAEQPVYSVCVDASECAILTKLCKANMAATVQFYIKKDDVLIVRYPVGTQGDVSFCYFNVEPDEKEVTPKKPTKKATKKPVKKSKGKNSSSDEDSSDSD